MRVEEEQVVGPARLADRPAEGIAVGLLRGLRRGIAVLLTHPARGVPVRIREGRVGRAPELVRAALGHRRDLQAARPAEFGLIALRQDLHLANRLDVQVQHLAVVAGVHGRDPVHHDVVLTGAAEPRGRGRGIGDVGTALRLRNHARREREQAREVLAVDGQVLDLLRGHREGSLTALGLQRRGLGRDRHDLDDAAGIEDERRDADAIAAADGDPRAAGDLERLERHLDRVGVGRHVREDVVAVVVGHDWRALRAA